MNKPTQKYYKYYLQRKKITKGAPINKFFTAEEEMIKKLVELAESVLFNPAYNGEFLYVSKKLNFTFDDIVNKILFYTLDINKIENKDYSNNAMRACLRLHSLVGNSYHRTRLKAVAKYMSNPKIKSSIEIGCCFPSDYVFNALKNKYSHITLTDMDKSALDYSAAVLEYYESEYAKKVNFNLVDMNKMEYPGDYDAYIFLDSLEHAKNPKAYLKYIVSQAKKGAHFIFSLPIVKIDSLKHIHHVEFLNEKALVDWLEKTGLKVINTAKATPNPKVDYFAELLVGEYAEIIVDSIKK